VTLSPRLDRPAARIVPRLRRGDQVMLSTTGRYLVHDPAGARASRPLSRPAVRNLIDEGVLGEDLHPTEPGSLWLGLTQPQTDGTRFRPVLCSTAWSVLHKLRSWETRMVQRGRSFYVTDHDRPPEKRHLGEMLVSKRIVQELIDQGVLNEDLTLTLQAREWL